MDRLMEKRHMVELSRDRSAVVLELHRRGIRTRSQLGRDLAMSENRLSDALYGLVKNGVLDALVQSDPEYWLTDTGRVIAERLAKSVAARERARRIAEAKRQGE